MSNTKITANEVTVVVVEKTNKLSAWVMDREHNTYELYTLKAGAVPADVWVSFEGQGKCVSKVHEPGQFGTLPDGPWDAGMFSMWARSFATYGMDGK